MLKQKKGLLRGLFYIVSGGINLVFPFPVLERLPLHRPHGQEADLLFYHNAACLPNDVLLKRVNTVSHEEHDPPHW
jgi:hypothetical protein